MDKGMLYTMKNEMEHNVTSDEIEDKIVQGIRNAKYLLWVAVPWLSNERIIDALMAKAEQGLNIRIIVSNEYNNKKVIDKFNSIVHRSGEIKIIPKWDKGNAEILFNKFCIIDLACIMHGSYNWSDNSRENVDIFATSIDKAQVNQFADEFLYLYNEVIPE